VLGHIQFLQRALQMACDSREMFFFYLHVFMRLAHILAGILIGTAERHRQKGFLFGDLAIHINIIEKVADDWIAQHTPVENIDCRIHGCCATNLLKYICHVQFSQVVIK
jgi:hypothetical protein